MHADRQVLHKMNTLATELLLRRLNTPKPESRKIRWMPDQVRHDKDRVLVCRVNINAVDLRAVPLNSPFEGGLRGML